ncbi:hypothetical protein, partial [Streptomyces zaomyceticus]
MFTVTSAAPSPDPAASISDSSRAVRCRPDPSPSGFSHGCAADDNVPPTEPITRPATADTPSFPQSIPHWLRSPFPSIVNCTSASSATSFTEPSIPRTTAPATSTRRTVPPNDTVHRIRHNANAAAPPPNPSTPTNASTANSSPAAMNPDTTNSRCPPSTTTYDPRIAIRDTNNPSRNPSNTPP